MKTLNLKKAVLSGLITYGIAITFFLLSFLIPIMKNPELQANITLAVVIIPAALIGARFYLRKESVNGILLGSTMFLIAGVMDALITVPFFVIPAGGDYISFFTDPGFWIIGLIFVTAIALYSRNFKKA